MSIEHAQDELIEIFHSSFKNNKSKYGKSSSQCFICMEITDEEVLVLNECFFRFQNRRYKAKRKQLLSQVNTTTSTRHAPVTVLVYENHAFSGNSSSSSSSRLAHHNPPLMIPSINL